MNPDTGRWITVGPIPKTRGRDYNHSTYCDLVITGLVGLRPREDDILEVPPVLESYSGNNHGNPFAMAAICFTLVRTYDDGWPTGNARLTAAETTRLMSAAASTAPRSPAVLRTAASLPRSPAF
jgi:hypothetical protein